jgi:hypothetical protein
MKLVEGHRIAGQQPLRDADKWFFACFLKEGENGWE